MVSHQNEMTSPSGSSAFAESAAVAAGSLNFARAAEAFPFGGRGFQAVQDGAGFGFFL